MGTDWFFELATRRLAHSQKGRSGIGCWPMISNLVSEVQQGTSPWRSAESVRLKFVELFETGWYYKVEGVANGPVTRSKLLSMYEAGIIGDRTAVRQATEQGWSNFRLSNVDFLRAKKINNRIF